ncbi:MAG: hypothetical protein DRP06_02380 [Candidatus Aenigmatarchaeota archaeon]|nr:MAG: hypothetical protein DRP06_02380 [Candidatus Aenigmarchaeota archaeon]
MDVEINNLPELNNEGLALDIDDTLSSTFGHWAGQMQKLFGNPENLSVEEIISKYNRAQNVPYWQSKEAKAWRKNNITSNELQMKLPSIPDSKIFIDKISNIVPLVVYITTRPESVIKGTKVWLKNNNFPNLPVICRPDRIPHENGIEWKAKILENLEQQVKGIVDDNPNLLSFLPQDYKGIIFLYGKDSINTKLNAIPCKDWETVYEEVKTAFNGFAE